jgi:ribonuclease HII
MVLGLDEVGRGCWAGPLVAGAVVLDSPIAGLKDSKLLSRLQRLRLSAEIELNAKAIGLGWVQPSEIDELGLTASVRLAMQRAVEQIKCAYDEIIIDGNLNFLSDNVLARAIIKADNSIAEVSAASIIAKVARDNWMIKEATKLYPQYQFASHVGYGTKLHQKMLEMYGPCDLHRKSYRPVAAAII